ncbi:MAG: 50S ribosomal protein L28 [Planctomycetota bacterium]|nr:50S ribosomal protein L28 [Planctomycetota bacterium]
MANRCEICGRGTVFGIKYARRGAARRAGGSGEKISGKVNRTFRVNLQRVRALVRGETRRMLVCTRCLKAGKVQKAPKRARRLFVAEAAAQA